MKIRTQNLISILPVFIGLALICGTLLFYVERQERLWGLSEEAKTSALSIAEFIAQRSMDSKRPDYTPKTDPQYMLAMSRILSHGRVLRVFQITPDSRQVVWGIPNAPSIWIPANERTILTADMVHDRMHVSNLVKLEADRAIIRGFAPMFNIERKLCGSIGVEIDASSYLKDMHDLNIQLAWMAGIVILIGFVIVLYTSQIITREINGLSGSAAAILKGNLENKDFDRLSNYRTEIRVSDGKIQEVNDLGNTFSTMNDVLNDILTRSKRTMIEGEQFRSRNELWNTYIEKYRPPLLINISGIQIAANAVGTNPGAFWTAFEHDRTIYTILGSIDCEDGLTAAVTASSLVEFLSKRIKDVGLDIAIHDTNTIYNPANLTVKSIRPDSNTDNIGRDRFVLHTFTDDLKEQVEELLDVVNDIPADELMQDIIASLPSETIGALLIVTYK